MKHHRKIAEEYLLILFRYLGINWYTLLDPLQEIEERKRMQLELNIGKKDEEMAIFLTNNRQLTKLGKNGIKTLSV